MKASENTKTLRILSLGAGVQSSALALMMEEGIFKKPDYAIFADTQAEPDYVYEYLDYLKKQLSYPVITVTAGNLERAVMDAVEGATKWANGKPPFFVRNKDGSIGMTKRQCTGDYKIDPIHKKIRELLGMRPGSRGPKNVVVESYIGISFDELQRMKPSRYKWITNEYPLVFNGIHRHHCIEYLEKNGYRIPKKSACWFCPYRSDAEWRDLKISEPGTFSRAVAFDRNIRSGCGEKSLRGVVYIHRSCKPIIQVDFRNAEDHGQTDLFNNECEGMCGV